MKIKEEAATKEIRAARDRMAQRIEKEGVFAFYASLAGRAAKLMARHRSPLRAPAPRSVEIRRAKRHAMASALPESKAIQEIRLIRDRMLTQEKHPGNDKHWTQVGQQGKYTSRRPGLKYEPSSSKPCVLHDKPAKKLP